MTLSPWRVIVQGVSLAATALMAAVFLLAAGVVAVSTVLTLLGQPLGQLSNWKVGLMSLGLAFLLGVRLAFVAPPFVRAIADDRKNPLVRGA